MNKVEVFNFEANEVRTVVIDNEAWFVGKDVATVLGYKNTKDALLKHVDDDDKLGSRITTSGQAREMVTINESGVYSLIFGSKLESAKRFKKWVTSEVLPAIRKHGAYMTDQKKGWTQSETQEVPRKDGTKKLVMNTKWTQKGRLGLYNLLKANGYLPVIEQDQPA